MPSDSVNIIAGVQFALLGIELNAGFEKTDAGERIFVL
jgi:hypothetical protein